VTAVLECVVNISEGRDRARLSALRRAAGPTLIDMHADPDHHRSVFTLAGTAGLVEAGVRCLASYAVGALDLGAHAGAHPRIGVVDVVPFVALEDWPLRPAALEVALDARDRFAAWAGATMHLPCFLYGPERSIPEIRRRAWHDLRPDVGPDSPHPTAGASAVGARDLLVAYNLWLEVADLARARAIAAEIRSADVRALGLAVGAAVQVSCNLLRPSVARPDVVFDAVAEGAPIRRAELVGLLPEAVLRDIPVARWSELGLDVTDTIESRLIRAGWRP